MNRVTSFHVIVSNILFVCERFSSINQTDHGHVDTFLFLKRLLDLQNSIGWLEVERLLHASESLSNEQVISNRFPDDTLSKYFAQFRVDKD